MNQMEISIPHLRVMFAEAAELGATCALAKAGIIKPFLKKAEAYRMYGRKTVEGWMKAGLIAAKRDGDHSTSYRLDRLQLEVLAKSNNWKAYVPMEDR